MAQPFTLLVNSSDGYADCWPPFFKLMARYWPGYQGPVLLNTETADFSWPGIDVRPTRSGEASPGRRPTWSECLLHSLEQSPTPIVLYVQEDYFLKSPVDHQALVELADTMLAKGITYLGLTEFGQRGPFSPASFDDRLWQISQKDPYRISLQACMIHAGQFARYVRPHENPWQFEWYGNIRARRRRDEFYTLNRDRYSLAAGTSLLPYDPTGVVTGRWQRDVVEELFAREGIEVDYTRRGWNVPGQGPPRKKAPMTLKKIINTLRSLV